ncbi:MAG TPA: hypothetical protein PKI00_01790 [Candidatus Pacearchaeota archaeon]|nr:hypothetical protein [Candidatus Pacearchaeota archaeon]
MKNGELSALDEIIIIILGLIGIFFLAIFFVIDAIDRKLFWKH